MKFPDNIILKRILVAFAAAVLIMWVYPHKRSFKYVYDEGRPWNYNQLIAPFDIPIHPDSATVEAIRDTLMQRFVPIYKYDATVVDSIVASLPAGPHSTVSRLGSVLRGYYERGVVTPASMSKIADGKLPKVRLLDRNIINESSTNLFTSPRDIYHIIDSVFTDPAMRSYLATFNLADKLKPNMVYSEEDNKRHFDNELQILTADRGVILQGQAIINKGDIITAQGYTNLKTYEELVASHMSHESHSTLLTWLGQFMYISLIICLLMGYFAIVAPKIFENFKAVVFLLSLITIFVICAALMNSFIPGGIYIVPVAIIPILVKVFFDGRSALFISVVSIMLMAPASSFPLEFIFLQFCATTAAVYSMRELSRRSQLLRTALVVATAYIVGYMALELLTNGTLDGWTWRMPAFLGANALLVSMAYILMFAVESIFGFVSLVTLIELSDTNQPLLRRLSDSCPGTFQHCMSVGNLASDAARAMGANELIVRAGALYHDIGKLENPAFFTENQHGVNPHDALPYQQSARIITSHVTDGLRLADKAGLPQVIKNFISEHHGAGTAKYFYFKAKQELPEGQELDPEPYSYPGPNPQSRETSLLMMADSVEAASRSLKDYTRESITKLVDNIIDTQIADGLHSDSTLEFRDIKIIKDAFIKRLMTMYHTRITYPAGAVRAQ